MPKFFYDFFDGDTWSKDDVGLDLPCAEQACVEAFEAARSMWRDLADGRRNPSVCAFDIRSETGQSLFRFEFAELLGGVGRRVSDEPASAIVRKIEDTHRRATEARSGLHLLLEQTLRSLNEARITLARLEAVERSGVGG